MVLLVSLEVAPYSVSTKKYSDLNSKGLFKYFISTLGGRVRPKILKAKYLCIISEFFFT